MFDSVADAVLDVSLQHRLAASVEGEFGGVDLGQHILAGDVLVDHTVNGLDLADDLLQPPVQIFRIHTLSHRVYLHTDRGI